MKFIVPYILALIILISNPVWFLWDVRFHIIFILVLILLLLLFPRFSQKENQKEFLNKFPIALLFISYFVLIVTFIGGYQTYLMLSSLILLFYILISDDEKRKALDVLTTFLSFILFFSLLAWVVHNYIYQLPMFNTISYYETKGSDKILENYIIFIQPKHDFIVRFYSIFDEPGTLGTLTAFVLYGNKYNFKDKRNIILLLASIVTFSMAFYLLFILGFLIQKIKNIKKLIIYFFVLIIVVAIVFFTFKDNSTFQMSVIDRFLNLTNSIDRRESQYLDSYFQQFLNYDNFMFGKGRSFIVDNSIIFEGQTYKFFIIEFGLIGIVLTIVTYLSIIKKISVLNIGCFLLFFISFIQRPFLLQPWQILLFILIIGTLEIKNQYRYDR